MHIADGIVPTLWCGVAHGVTWTGVWASGRKPDPAEVVRMGLLASATFAISLIHFPLGGTSVHLGLYGLTGILVGWRGFASVVAALILHAFLFQHGGLLSLGLNAVNMGSGVILAAALWRYGPLPQPVRAFLCGFLGITLPALLLAAEFALAGYGKGFYFVSTLYLGAAVLEGVLTAGIVAFLAKTRVSLLRATPA